MAITLRYIVYDIREKLKLMTDDSKWTDDYLIHCVNVKRALLIKQKYQGLIRKVPDTLKQTICITMSPQPTITGLTCETISKSTTVIPEFINFNDLIGITKIGSRDISNIPFNYVGIDRFPYIGNNRLLKSQVYVTIGADRYLYLKAADPQYKLIKYLRITGLFSNPEEVLPLDCDGVTDCEIMDNIYSIEESLISPLVQMIVQELGQSLIQMPEDKKNNAEQGGPELPQQTSQG